MNAMNIKDRLKIYDSLNKVVETGKGRERAKPDITIFKGFSVQETPHGPSYIRTRVFDSTHVHGNTSLSRFAEINNRNLPYIGRSRELSDIDISKLLFFDTESTGLSSGTGTHIFLAGFGYFSESRFIIKQFFLRDFDEEVAFLFSINELMKEFECLVSYNGKSYDWPLLQTRLTYARMKDPVKYKYHIDLLHHSRRIWKRRLSSCNLENIEREILNFIRYDDTPGYLIPGIYFDYLRNYKFQPIQGIIDHNLNDIISLAALLIIFDNIVKDPFGTLEHPTDRMSLAHYYDQIQEFTESVRIYESLCENEMETAKRTSAKIKLGNCYKRSGQWDLAVKIWTDLIERTTFNLEVYIELAKYYEHRSGEYDRAIEIVTRALASLEIMDEIDSRNEYREGRLELNRRLERLNRKVNKHNFGK